MSSQPVLGDVNARAFFEMLREAAPEAATPLAPLLDRLFEGQLAPFIAHFSERQNLSNEEIAELKKLIQGLDDGR